MQRAMKELEKGTDIRRFSCSPSISMRAMLHGYLCILFILFTGNAEFGLLPLDPFKVQQLRLDKGGGGALSMDMTLSDAELVGFKNAKVESVKYVSGHLEFDLFNKIHAIRHYNTYLQD